MSVQCCDYDDARSMVSEASGAVSQAYSCPPVPLRKRARMKKAAPLPPSKVTTPLSLSLTDLQQPPRPPSSRPASLQSLHHHSVMSASLSRDQGDECAINELLEGRMDLDVVLPDARKVRMNVERRTPMMDLLVQVTTAHKVNPGGHVIHIPTDRGRDYLPYKPSTPIGSLDINSIHIVPKSAVFDPPVKRMPKMANKPFEQTFRLQVNLPRNQLMVLRVGPRTTLGEVKMLACKDKNLDASRYMLAHPQRPDALLDLNGTMATYGATEITLMSNSNFNANVCNSTSDLIAYTREDSQKKKGILGLFTRKKSKGSVVDSSSDSLDSRGVSPSRSDGSGPRNSSAKVSIKKRPAPPPPAKPTNQKMETTPPIPTTTVLPTIVDEHSDEQPVVKSDGSNVSHSRHSSDSSGYHEASLLSESPDNHSLDVGSGSGSSGLSMDSASQPVKSRRKSSTPTRPTKERPIITTSLSDTQLLVTAANRKRRAPPPPPVLRVTDSEASKVPISPCEVMEAVILEEPVTEEEEEEVDQGVESKTSSPEPACSPPASEVEDLYRSHPTRLTESPTDDHSPPASPHTDSGLALGDESDPEEMDYPRHQGLNEEDNWSLGDRGPLIAPPSPFINPKLSGDGTMHEAAVEAVAVSPFRSRAQFFTSMHHWDGSNHSTTDIGRRSSLTSLATIDDVQNSFDLTIAEAQKVLDDEEKRLSLSSEGFQEDPEEADPQVVQVTQRQILSRIEAAFSAVEQEEEDVSKPVSAIPKDDDLGWDYTIPEPPLGFRNDNALLECGGKPRSSSQSSTSSDGVPPPLPALPPPAKEHSRPKKPSPPTSPKKTAPLVTPVPSSAKTLPIPPAKTSVLRCVTEPAPPPVKDPQPTYLLKNATPIKESSPVVQDPEEVESRDTIESQLQAPRTRRPPLLNFTIGTYRKPKEDIFSAFHSVDAKTVPKSAPVTFGEPLSVPVSDSASDEFTPTKTNKQVHVYGMEGSVRGIKGHVRLRCAEMVDTVGPSLVARSASMLSLTPTSRKIEVDGKVKNVHRTNSTVADNLRKAQSVQDLNSEDTDANLEQEQERLQQEYSKLHQQFLVWNQQLQDNQNLLEKQKIVSASNLLPSLAVIEPKMVVTNAKDSKVVNGISCVAKEVAARSQTLPRTRPKPVVEPVVEQKQTFTLDRRPKSQILTNVSIGSWQQRKSNENINTLPPTQTENTQFYSLESSNHVISEQKRNGYHPSTKPPVTKRPVSMYASWQKPPGDEPDKTKPKFDIQFSSNQSSQPNSLRMSNTKTYFKPPEVKSTSFSRQRIPPEDIQPSTKDSGPMSGNWKIQPKDPNSVGDNLVAKKFVFGQKDSKETNGGGRTVTYLNGDKPSSESNIKTVQINGKIPNSSGLTQRPSFTIKSVPKVVGFRANGSSEPSPTNPSPPPPPPPPPQVPIKATTAVTPPTKPPVQRPQQAVVRSAKSAQLLNANKLDPREELMLEIRNFGGRKTLRKVPVNQINWQLKVHGSNSKLTA